MSTQAIAQRAAAWVFVASVLGGCALWPYNPGPPPDGVLDVRFWPQDAYQCGPAALAMAMSASNVPVTPDDLVDAVYLPARHGSLQAEMLAAPRRYERIAYRVPTQAHALKPWLEQGLPVVVLLNLGTSWWPVWHYAVVIGADDDNVWLHSGVEAEISMRRSAFERHWRGAHHWAMVVVPPEQIPDGLTPAMVVQTLAQLEQRFPELAKRAYVSALERWPENDAMNFGLANSYRAGQQWPEALQLLQTLHEKHPRSPPIANNLALTYQQMSQRQQALDVLRPVLADLPKDSTWREVLESTWHAVQRDANL